MDIRHFGGTSLAGATARPVIDLIAGMSDLSGLNQASTLIEGLNFRRETTPDWCADELCALLLKPRVGEATHAVLVVRNQGSLWRRAMAISERLTQRADERQALQQIKVEHFQSGCSAQADYEAAKAAFFSDLEYRIENEG